MPVVRAVVTVRGLPDLRGMEWDEYAELVTRLAEPAYRARQLFRWVQRVGEEDFAAMTDLPLALREALPGAARVSRLEVLERLEAPDGRTAKYLLRLPDGMTVETVRLSYTGRRSRDRHTVCLSTQVGCAMGCAFCATGLGGWRRNLSAGEMVGQVLVVQRELAQSSQGEVTNLVLMGMGEPLANYRRVLKALRILHHPQGLNIGWRRITVSTCGLVPQIERLAGEGLPLVLAVSLHAPDDALRDRLVPINRRYPLARLLAACRHYAGRTGRRITFEYALAAGLNDSREQARALARLIRGIPANVNLIPVNPVPETGLRRPPAERVAAFRRELEAAGVEAVVREEMGSSIQAACGQLRGRRGAEV